MAGEKKMSSGGTELEDLNISGVPLVKVNAEVMCLGLMMEDHRLVPYVRQYLRPEDFYRASHGIIANVIYWLADRDVQPDPAAVRRFQDPLRQRPSRKTAPLTPARSPHSAIRSAGDRR